MIMHGDATYRADYTIGGQAKTREILLRRGEHGTDDLIRRNLRVIISMSTRFRTAAEMNSLTLTGYELVQVH